MQAFTPAPIRPDTHALARVGAFSQPEEIDLATRLLEVTDEAELDGFVGTLLQRASAATGVDLDAAARRALGRRLTGIAKRAGLVNAGRLIPPAVRQRAARLFGLELEALSPEDQDLELARRLVRLAGAAVEKAGGGTPADVALARAARRHAPGLVARLPSPPTNCPCGCREKSCGCAGDTSRNPTRSHAMHDIDRTQTEYDPELDSLELDETDSYELTDELTDELGDAEYNQGQYEGEYNDELDAGELDAGETDSPFSEVEESELANELLGISSEGELDQFLGKVFKKAFRGVRNLAGRHLGKIAGPLGGVLKGVAKKLLPVAAGAAGTFFGGPAGAALGSKLGSVVGNALESELQGLESEERDFEVARTFVRMAGNAAQTAARSPVANPVAAVKNAVIGASRRVPGALRRRRFGNGSNYGSSQGGAYGGSRRTGRWVRRGNRIILYGV